VNYGADCATALPQNSPRRREQLTGFHTKQCEHLSFQSGILLFTKLSSQLVSLCHMEPINQVFGIEDED
jgi:hypothetical protein